MVVRVDLRGLSAASATGGLAATVTYTSAEAGGPPRVGRVERLIVAVLALKTVCETALMLARLAGL